MKGEDSKWDGDKEVKNNEANNVPFQPSQCSWNDVKTHADHGLARELESKSDGLLGEKNRVPQRLRTSLSELHFFFRKIYLELV